MFGPYERRVVLEQGSTDINGPHQGAWVTTQTGEDWFFHFQELLPYGRIVHLQPMSWEDDWPIIGNNGEPVLTHRKPNVGATHPIVTPIESDEFDGETIGLQWQWHANPQPWWGYVNRDRQQLRMFSVPLPEGSRNLWSAMNMLLQKFPGPEFTVNTKLTFTPNPSLEGERAGLIIMGFSYANLAIEKTAEGYVLTQNECWNSNNGTPEVENARVLLPSGEVYLRVSVGGEGALCTFFYSTDGVDFQKIGKPYPARAGRWMGARMGFFHTRPRHFGDGGWIDVDFFRVTR